MKMLDKKERMTYQASVLRFYGDYEEMVFNLSEESQSETIENIKNMTLGQRLKFQELIQKKADRIRSRSNGREDL